MTLSWLDQVRRGTREDLERASSTLADLRQAAAELEAAALEGLRAGGWRTVREVAEGEGVARDTVRRTVALGARESVIAPARGRGPAFTMYVRVREES